VHSSLYRASLTTDSEGVALRLPVEEAVTLAVGVADSEPDAVCAKFDKRRTWGVHEGRRQQGGAESQPRHSGPTPRRCKTNAQKARTTEDERVSLALLVTEPVAVRDALAEREPLALIEADGETLLLAVMLPVGVPEPLLVCSAKVK
jgi:hypothetical protein